MSPQIKTISVERLKPAPYNPRKPLSPESPEYQRLERSLREFSLVQPIIWNEQTGHVVGGHQRLEILKNQGIEQLDVVVVSLSLDREKALNITLNNSNVGSEWDTTKLIDLVSELDSLPDFDSTLTGFDADEIQDLLLTPDPDFAPKPLEGQQKNVLVSLEIPAEEWEKVRPELDQTIQRHHLQVHIKLPH